MEGAPARQAAREGVKQTVTARLLIVLLAIGALRADLQQAKAEPNLEKRAMHKLWIM